MRPRSPLLAFALLAVCSFSACSSTIETSNATSGGPDSPPPPPPPPPPPASLPDPGVRLAQGMKPTCVKRADGTVRCWSYSGDPAAGPLDLVGIDDAVAVVQSIEQGCALHATGQVSCWGFSHKGQLGLAVAPGETSVDPVLLPEVSLVKITSGHHAVCGIEASGQAVCWGGQYDGPLGDPSLIESQAPVDVVGVGDAVDISASFGEVCAVRATGGVACWHDQELPFEVAGVTQASHVATGIEQSCAIVEQGSVVCWHDGSAPAAVPGLDDVAQISVTFGYACARRATGRVTCWSAVPGSSDFEDVAVDDAVDVVARDTPSGGCAVRSSGEVVCWLAGQAPSPVP